MISEIAEKDEVGASAGTLVRGKAGNNPPAPRMSKHEQRTAETRELLLRAAETVFTRDGYERADLDDIAKMAGRTKGAIYGQFESKEAIFLALIEQHSLRHRDAMQRLRQHATTAQENMAALRTFYLDLLSNDSFGLLLLEFRLYAIRHPDSWERMARLFNDLLPANEDAAYVKLLGQPNRKDLGRAVSIHAIFAVLYALEVEMRFNPALFRAEESRVVAERIFDCLVAEA